MKLPVNNNQASIASKQFSTDSFTAQIARMAFFKIKHYKFTLIRPSFMQAREELRTNIRNTLFNFVPSASVLSSVNMVQPLCSN